MIITAALALLLVPSCVITARLHVVATPDVGESFLTGVAAVSPTDVWATGESFFQTYRGGVEQPLILHWNGRSWRNAATPDLGYAALADVVALAGNDVWAVGFRAGGGPITVVPLLLHFNGQRWTEVAAPRLPNWASLSSISAVSAHDIWAVGRLTAGDTPGSSPSMPLTLHFDGSTWRRVPFPAVSGTSASLGKVAAAGHGAVYAVGSYSHDEANPPGRPLVARWDGHAWTLLPLTGIQPDAELRDVAVAGSDVWVVGDRANAAGPIEGLAWRSHAGSRWTSYRPDPHPRGVLNGVYATSAREVWAAGTPGNDGTGDGVLLTRWDGRRWKVAFRIPAVPELRGLADVTTAGGHVFSVGGTTKTLAVQN